jgi:hypothetical protein
MSWDQAVNELKRLPLTSDEFTVWKGIVTFHEMVDEKGIKQTKVVFLHRPLTLEGEMTVLHRDLLAYDHRYLMSDDANHDMVSLSFKYKKGGGIRNLIIFAPALRKPAEEHSDGVLRFKKIYDRGILPSGWDRAVEGDRLKRYEAMIRRDTLLAAKLLYEAFRETDPDIGSLVTWAVAGRGSEGVKDRLDVVAGLLEGGDTAVLDRAQNGGIDLTSDKMNLDVRRQGEGVQFKIDPAQIERLKGAAGLTPVIIDVLPLKSLHEFLNLP